jgi:ribonuclease HII
MALTKTKKKKRRPDHFKSKAFSTRKIGHDDFSPEQVTAFQELLFFDQDIFNDQAQSESTLFIGVDEVGRGSIAGPVCTGAYSCTTFYKTPEDLLKEIKIARQVISDQLLNTNDRDSYYAETICNDLSIADDLNQLSFISSLLNLEDSKKVSKAKRELLTEALKQVPCLDNDSHLFLSTDFQKSNFIDKNGIVEAIWTSMANNIFNLVDQYYEINNYLPQEVLVLVDGPKIITKIEARAQKYSELFQDIQFKQIPIKKGDSKSSLIAAASNLAKLTRDKYMTEIALDYNDYGWANNAGYGTKRHYEAIAKYGLTKEHRKSYLKEIA